MKCLKNPDELRLFRDSVRADKQANTRTVWVCGGTGCLAWGSAAVLEALKRVIAEKGLNTEVKLRCESAGCHGQCERGPLIEIAPEGWIYEKVKPEDAEQIVETTLIGRALIPRLVPKDTNGRPCSVPTAHHIPFLAHQKRLILSRMGHTSPVDIEDYVREGGYAALEKALREMTPEQICQAISDSGLRGRGGGGFPTGVKWESCRKSPGDIRYVLVNGDEGDPGAFMDRSLMEGDPHSVIEGLILGGYAVGAAEGYIYVRNEYPLAIKHLIQAIEDAESLGLLGENILGTGFNFTIQICRGGGAFVCGESTALMTSIEGKPGVPRVKYIRSTEKGLFEKPTVLNNVETWANVPYIVLHGAEEFRKIGTENSPGTKVFALVGKVKSTGLVEIPMGTTLRQIIFDIGGGVMKNRPFKAVQTGGPSGGCLPESALDLPVDFDTLTSAGSMMGSGGMIVMDDRTCMVDVARYFISFLADESCGKCVPCREGLKKLKIILDDLTSGRAQPGDTDLLESLAKNLADTALCGLGQSACNPVLSTIRNFGNEYAEHEKDGFCRSGTCKGLFRALVNEKCVGCGACKKACPTGAISGEIKKKHAVIADRCIGCGACLDACAFGAIAPARKE